MTQKALVANIQAQELGKHTIIECYERKHHESLVSMPVFRPRYLFAYISRTTWT